MSQHDQSNNDLGRTLGRIEATLEGFQQTLERFDHHLFGNGQPGKLSEIDTHLTATDERVDDLERSRSWIKGGAAAITGLVSMLGLTEMYHLLFGKR